MTRFQILDSKKWVVVNRYNKELLIHIREYETEGEKTYPTKKGVCFSAAILATFRMLLIDISQALKSVKLGIVEEYSAHVGRGIYCTITKDFCFANLRYFFTVDGKPMPTKKGICLNTQECEELRDILRNIHDLDDEIQRAMPCLFSGSHTEPGSCVTCYPINLRKN